MFWLGFLLFALGILVSVCLHEAGHMLTAKAYGMKVTQYFAGFGPTLWSTKRGETEYGVKAIPAGGFVKIVGMTPLEPVAPEDEPRSFWRAPLRKRTVVLAAGSLTHFGLALVVAYIAALTTGLPNMAWQDFDPAKASAVVEVTDCVVPVPTRGECEPGDPAGSAKAAGLQNGDRITAVGSTPVANYGELVKVLQAAPAGATPVTYERAGATQTATVDLVPVQRYTPDATEENPTTRQVSAIGVSVVEPERTLHYGAVGAVGGTLSFGKELFTGTFEAIGRFPSRIDDLVTAIGGAERSPETPVSVLGASRIGGEALEIGEPIVFLTIFVSLNVFIGVFNLFPLLPLDGGHIAIAWYERARAIVARRRGRPEPGRVDYEKLLPLTYAVMLVFVSVSLLALTADIVNPIRLS
ncbi:M50 family metallopeptidase [Motilibacter aurantiacus]|uniref:M50 family metallopeptidase n=1 Tax=Motilibacter aurantiacus TaxID=2714955 RepID=UPI0014094B4C|nr:site-2 protease family protein [Motilibacter aurantiacus]NHC44609.1 site-2 protease family protein [Motilibacter aurantiacus]